MRIRIFQAHCHAHGALLLTKRGAHSVMYGWPDQVLELANHACDPEIEMMAHGLHREAQQFNPPVLPANFTVQTSAR